MERALQLIDELVRLGNAVLPKVVAAHDMVFQGPSRRPPPTASSYGGSIGWES